MSIWDNIIPKANSFDRPINNKITPEQFSKGALFDEVTTKITPDQFPQSDFTRGTTTKITPEQITESAKKAPVNKLGQLLSANTTAKKTTIWDEAGVTKPITPQLDRAMQLERKANNSLGTLFKEGKQPSIGNTVVGFGLDVFDTATSPVVRTLAANKMVKEVAEGKADPILLDNINQLKKTNLQILGDSAQSVLTFTSINLGAKLAQTAVSGAGQATLKQGLAYLGKAAANGALEGSFQGVQNGIAQALSSGSKDPNEITKIILANTAGGTALGGVLGGAGAGISLGAPILKNGIVKVVQGINETKLQQIEDLVSQGYSQADAIKIQSQGGYVANPFNRGVDVVMKGTDVVPSKISTFAKSLQEGWTPIKALEGNTKNIFLEHGNQTRLASELGQATFKELDDIPAKTGWQTILDYQAGKDIPVAGKIKAVFDDLRQKALDAGFEVSERQNYLPQIYKNKSDEVVTAVSKYLTDRGIAKETIANYIAGKANLSNEEATRLGLSPFFTKQRVFPDYDTALKYGLTPKYTTVQQLAGAYRSTLEKDIANKKLLDSLVETGQIATQPYAGSKPINLEFSPTGYYGDPKVATILNNAFHGEANLGGKFLGLTGNLSKYAQEVTLSGGLGNVNSFSVAHALNQGATAIGDMAKSVGYLATGNTKMAKSSLISSKSGLSNVAAFVRANFTPSSIRFFADNAKLIEEATANGGIIVPRTGSYTTAYKNAVASPTFKSVFGAGWHKLFEEKTFGNYMPMISVNTYKYTKQAAIAAGMTEEAAGKLAAQQMNLLAGVVDSTGRSQGTQDLMSSVFFAPKFRESMINLFVNNLKSVTTQLGNKDFAKNRSNVIGMTMIFAAYNAMNKITTGHYMWQNEPGKEFDLKIPIGKDQYAYVGFMPSILTVPRNIASGSWALAKGDIKTAKQKFGSFFSTPVKLVGEIWNNRNYFGGEIYSDTDSAQQKAKDIASYLGVHYNHPFIGAAILALKNKSEDTGTQQNVIETVSKFLELPFKFNSQSDIDKAAMYRLRDERTKANKAIKEKVRPLYEQVQELRAAGNDIEAQSIVDNLTEEQFTAYKVLKATDTKSATAKGKLKMIPTVKKVKELRAAGNDTEAQAIVDGLSEQDFKYYKLAKQAIR